MFILIIMYITQRPMTNEKKKSQRAVSKCLDQHEGIQSITFKNSVCFDSILSCQILNQQKDSDFKKCVETPTYHCSVESIIKRYSKLKKKYPHHYYILYILYFSIDLMKMVKYTSCTNYFCMFNERINFFVIPSDCISIFSLLNSFNDLDR